MVLYAKGETMKKPKPYSGYREVQHDLTAADRNKMSSSTFGLPGARKYPMPDRSHAANAKARASQQLAKDNLSSSQKAQIDRKANKILGK